MAHYDVAGELRPHVRGQVEALAASVDTLLVCTTAQLTDAARAWLVGALGPRGAGQLRLRLLQLQGRPRRRRRPDGVRRGGGLQRHLRLRPRLLRPRLRRDGDPAVRLLGPHRRRARGAAHPVVLRRLPALGGRLARLHRLLGGDGAHLQATPGDPALRGGHVATPLRRGLRLRHLLRRDRRGPAHRPRADAVVGRAPLALPAHPRRGPRVARARQRAVEPGAAAWPTASSTTPGCPTSRSTPCATTPTTSTPSGCSSCASAASRSASPACASSSRRPRSTTRCATPSGCCPTPLALEPLFPRVRYSDAR